MFITNMSTVGRQTLIVWSYVSSEPWRKHKRRKHQEKEMKRLYAENRETKQKGTNIKRVESLKVCC